MEGKKVAVVITREGMGEGDPDLQRRLLGNFLHALEAERQFPSVICLYTEGVRVAAEGSPFVANLQTLEALGVRILICRTCLETYALVEKVAVGTIGTMAGIVWALFEADSVIRL